MPLGDWTVLAGLLECPKPPSVHRHRAPHPSQLEIPPWQAKYWRSQLDVENPTLAKGLGLIDLGTVGCVSISPLESSPCGLGGCNLKTACSWEFHSQTLSDFRQNGQSDLSRGLAANGQSYGPLNTVKLFSTYA